MTNYSFILLSGEKEGFLNKLRDLGVMDITRSSKPVDHISYEMMEDVQACKMALSELRRADFSKDPDIEQINEVLSDITPESLSSRMDHINGKNQPNGKGQPKNSKEFDAPAIANACAKNIWDLKEDLRNAKREVEDRRPWGNFSFESIDKIEKQGYKLRWYVVSQKRFSEEWANEYPLEVINDEGSRVYFITIMPNDVEYDFPIAESEAPKGTYLDSEAKVKEIKRQIIQEKATMLFLKSRIEEIESKYRKMTSDLDLYLAKESSESAVENKITIFEGFAPDDNKDEIIKALEEEDGVYYSSRDAKAEDNPPIKLKNNAFSSIFETIGNFYMLPKYDELDLTPFFAPFYMLFFGMCLGDFGYGLVLFILGVAGLFMFPKKKNVANLVLLLGLGAMIMASMSGTIFGGNMADWFKVNENNQLLSFLGTDKETGNPKSWPFSNLDLFWFSMIFGIVQIIFGRLISAVYAMRKCGWQAGLANIGWTSLIIWITLYFIEWYHKWEPGTVMSPALSYALLGIAGVGILFFTATTGNIIIRVLKGLVSLYDVTGLLGDVLSYIRLFALGVSGGILGMVFNSMALQLGEVPYVGWLLCLVLLIVGHSLVLFLSGLSAFVHPMRLTFVEFYKNAGFEGGGRKYKPLSK